MSYVSPENSKILYGNDARAAADGVDSVAVKVRLRDHKNKPVAGRTVELYTADANAIIEQPTGPTDADGIALGYVKSSEVGNVTINCRVVPTPAAT